MTTQRRQHNPSFQRTLAPEPHHHRDDRKSITPRTPYSTAATQFTMVNERTPQADEKEPPNRTPIQRVNRPCAHARCCCVKGIISELDRYSLTLRKLKAAEHESIRSGTVIASYSVSGRNHEGLAKKVERCVHQNRSRPNFAHTLQ
jgi:hypothetical protein